MKAKITRYLLPLSALLLLCLLFVNDTTAQDFQTVKEAYEAGRTSTVNGSNLSQKANIPPPTNSLGSIICPPPVTTGNDPGVCGAVVNYATPTYSASTTIHNQPGNNLENGRASSTSWPLTVADDFFVPASACWAIDVIKTPFFTINLGSITAFNVKFYSDAAGFPGTELHSFIISSANFSSVLIGNKFGFDVYRFDINLPSTLSLCGGGAGTEYWLSVQAVSPERRHYWEFQTATQYGSPAVNSNDGNSWSAIRDNQHVFSFEGQGGTPCTSPTSIPNYTYLGEFGGHRYFRSNFSRTWNQAKTMAEGLGAHLVTLSSEAESEFVKGNGQMAWIGLTDEAVEGTFAWVTGEPYGPYTNWWPGDPNNNGGDEDYVLMNFYGSTKWVDEGTNYFHRFIIEFDCAGVTQTAGLPSGSVFPVGVTTNSFSYTDGANNTATCSFTVTVNDVEPPTLTCPATIITPATSNAGAVITYNSPVLTDNCYSCVIPNALPNYTYIGQMNGHKYFRSNFSRTWAQAKALATGLGGHLVTIGSAAENSLLAGPPAWIGFTDEAVEGNFVWVTGEPVTYTNWWPGEPNNNGGDEDYAFMNFYGSNLWVDYGTNYFYPFIVEFECNPTLTQTEGFPSGATFPVGFTTNTFTYMDGGGNLASCSFLVRVTPAPPLPNPITQTDIEKTMEVRTYPNPSAGDFNLLVISESNDPITVRILDETGNIKKVLMANSITKTLKVGNDLPAGKYIAEVIQGTSVQTVKLVKLK